MRSGCGGSGYRAAKDDPGMLDRIKRGDQVEFSFVQSGRYTVTEIK